MNRKAGLPMFYGQQSQPTPGEICGGAIVLLIIGAIVVGVLALTGNLPHAQEELPTWTSPPPDPWPEPMQEPMQEPQVQARSFPDCRRYRATLVAANRGYLSAQDVLNIWGLPQKRDRTNDWERRVRYETWTYDEGFARFEFVGQKCIELALAWVEEEDQMVYGVRYRMVYDRLQVVVSHKDKVTVR